MSLLWNIFDEHKHLLELKGYDEKSLNSSDKEGWFMRQFQVNLSKSLRDAHNFNEKADFKLRATGFFNNDIDIVLFKFHYEYNPENMELYLKRLEANLDGHKLNLQFNSNKELVPATEVYRRLSELIKLEKAKAIANEIDLSQNRGQSKKL